MPADGSTIVQGDAKAPLCNMYRTWLQFYAYAKDPGGIAPGPQVAAKPDNGDVPTQFQQQVFSDTTANWYLVDQTVDDNGSGLKAQRWDPKQRADGQVSLCEPTIVFRGSRMNFNHFAIEGRASLYGMINFHFVLYPSNDPHAPFSTAIKLPWKIIGPDPEALTTGFIQQNWLKTDLIDESAWIQVPGATEGFSLPTRISLKATIWAGRDGDWANNINQGLGNPSKLYQDAIKFARKHVNDIVDKAQGNTARVFFAGHSLGGGLASAAAEQMQYEFSANKKLFIRGITFNSAGLNQKTLSQYARLRAAPLNAYSIKNEILTTLQSFTTDIPLVSSLLRLAGKSLPPAVTNLVPPALGINPGSNGYAEFGHKGDCLPILFPLSAQTFVETRKLNGAQDTVSKHWPGIAILDEALNSSTVLEFGQKLLNILHDRYFEEARQATASPLFTFLDQKIAYTNIKNIYIYAGRKAFDTFGDEMRDLGSLLGSAVQYHLMPVVAETFKDMKLQ